MVNQESGNVRSLVTKAAADPAFAAELIQHPEKFQREFGLTREQIDSIKVLFGKGTLADLAAGGNEPILEGDCYY